MLTCYEITKSVKSNAAGFKYTEKVNVVLLSMRQPFKTCKLQISLSFFKAFNNGQIFKPQGKVCFHGVFVTALRSGEGLKSVQKHV